MNTARHRTTRPRTTRRAMAELVALSAVLVVGAVALIATDHTPDAAPQVPPCATEDAAGPCHWDATTQGNGRGQSFTVLTDGTTVTTGTLPDGTVYEVSATGEYTEAGR